MPPAARHLHTVAHRVPGRPGAEWYGRLTGNLRRSLEFAGSALLSVALAIPVVLAGFVLVLRLAVYTAGLIFMMTIPLWRGGETDD